MNRFRLTTLATLMFASLGAQAADFDGAKPMLCAAMDVFECIDGEACKEVRAQDVNAPEFFRLDLSKNKASVRRADKELPPQIRSVESLDGTLLVQGVGAENPLGWSLTINEETGRMVVSVAGDETAFILFGACTLL